jgi:hypothetical protein
MEFNKYTDNNSELKNEVTNMILCLKSLHDSSLTTTIYLTQTLRHNNQVGNL